MRTLFFLPFSKKKMKRYYEFWVFKTRSPAHNLVTHAGKNLIRATMANSYGKGNASVVLDLKTVWPNAVFK